MTVCLTMIVRDEAPIIERCLLSVLPLIDSWCIVDTGSSDGTQEIIRDQLAHLNGELHERPWRDFGTNRTELLALARDEGDWLLRMDADWTVEALHPKMGEWLADDSVEHAAAYNVLIHDASVRYRLPLLTRGGMEWRYVGSTHECLDPAGRWWRPLTGMAVRHHHDGASRPEKFQRDRELLEAEHAADPMNARVVFYLASTYRDLGETEKAITMFDLRAAMNGWEEERWYASFQAAKLRGDVGALLAAYDRRPHRHEPLAAAAALVAAQGGEADVLFIEGV